VDIPYHAIIPNTTIDARITRAYDENDPATTYSTAHSDDKVRHPPPANGFRLVVEHDQSPSTTTSTTIIARKENHT
jgi:hypothetical protein